MYPLEVLEVQMQMQQMMMTSILEWHVDIVSLGEPCESAGRALGEPWEALGETWEALGGLPGLCCKDVDSI
jgi:hypothetical protein